MGSSAKLWNASKKLKLRYMFAVIALHWVDVVFSPEMTFHLSPPWNCCIVVGVFAAINFKVLQSHVSFILAKKHYTFLVKNAAVLCIRVYNQPHKNVLFSTQYNLGYFGGAISPSEVESQICCAAYFRNQIMRFTGELWK